MNLQNQFQAKSRTEQVMLPVYQLRCGSAQSLERKLARIPGVVEVYVNPATERAYIEYYPDLTNPERLKLEIKQAGYGHS
jgi:P-type Cu+ transporter